MVRRAAWVIFVGLAACKEPPAGKPAAAAPEGVAAIEAVKPPRLDRTPPADAELIEYAPDRRGFFYRPAGAGPFPVMVWNHGSERKPGWQAPLAHFYVDHGWAFLLPHRRGHGQSPGPYIGDEPDDARVMALQEAHNEDVVAAIAWVKQQPHIDPARVAVSGCSYGGIQTMITAARPIGIRAAIAFAPGAMRWSHSQGLQMRLIRAAREAQVPELIIQAENDYDLSPSKARPPSIPPPAAARRTATASASPASRPGAPTSSASSQRRRTNRSRRPLASPPRGCARSTR
jgi:dienelactone hydrolase